MFCEKTGPHSKVKAVVIAKTFFIFGSHHSRYKINRAPELMFLFGMLEGIDSAAAAAQTILLNRVI